MKVVSFKDGACFFKFLTISFILSLLPALGKPPNHFAENVQNPTKPTNHLSKSSLFSFTLL